MAPEPSVSHDPGGIPEILKTLKCWVAWEPRLIDGVWKKPPIAVDGRTSFPLIPERGGSYEAAAAMGKGVGIILGEYELPHGSKVRIGADDYDDLPSVDPPPPWVVERLRRMSTYAEVSPSGEGIHAVYAHRCEPRVPVVESHDGSKLEVFTCGKYLTITGLRIGDCAEVNDCTDAVAEVFGRADAEFNAMMGDVMTSLMPANPASAAEDELNAIFAAKYVAKMAAGIQGQEGNRATFRAARVIFGDFALPYELGWPILEEYNARCLPPWSNAELERMARSDHSDPRYPRGCKRLTRRADEYGTLAQQFSDLAQVRWWNGSYYRYDGVRYRLQPDGVVEAELRKFVADHYQTVYEAMLRRAQGKVKPYRTRMSDARETAGALRSIALLDGSIPMPSLLPDGEERALVAVGNGLLDPLEGKLLDHTPDWFDTARLPYDYDRDADCPQWKGAIARAMNPQKAAVLQEFFGYCLIRRVDAQKCLILLGEGATGKSTISAGMEAMLGSENVSALGIEKFGERFQLVSTLGKFVNICSECTELSKTAEGMLKSFISGDKMAFERKGKDTFDAHPRTKVLLPTNALPYIGDRSDGAWRRFIIIQMKRKVRPEDRVPGMDKPEFWRGEAPGILNWGLEGLARLAARGFEFTRLRSSERAIDEHRDDCSTARSYLKDECMAAEDGWLESRKMYYYYVMWCEENGHRNPMNKNNFTKEIKKVFRRAERKTCWTENGAAKGWRGIKWKSHNRRFIEGLSPEQRQVLAEQLGLPPHDPGGMNGVPT